MVGSVFQKEIIKKWWILKYIKQTLFREIVMSEKVEGKTGKFNQQNMETASICSWTAIPDNWHDQKQVWPVEIEGGDIT